MANKKPRQNLTGQRFGRLVVESLVCTEAAANIPTLWLCKCDCGNKAVVRATNLRSGNTNSCGCLQKEIAKKRNTTHGQSGTRLYVAWQHMIGRCTRKSDGNYQCYGGRGITVCPEWLNSFEAFRDWSIANGYDDDLTIDRIDVNGNYCPENCRWISHDEQQRNKTNNTFIDYGGTTKTVGEWAREFDCVPASVYREILLREGRVHGWQEKN